ncbi:MAG: histidinol-phosphate aminotransferase [Bacillota bacterium]|nr:histidinol-phosphate aminotransferase [Bacillota bacterium]MDK2855040.1 histidinol-phosphate aminotransferase [Bacillota bacterium]MDK2924838.1 histidinol-phosphate aminotransferase [Bacillota bacterium]
MDFLRQEAAALPPYQPFPSGAKVKLDMNENPFPLPEPVRRAACEIAARLDFARYGDSSATALRAALAAYAGVPPEMVFCGNGSDEIIHLLLTAFGGNGRRVIIPRPTFVTFRREAVLSGAELVEVPLAPDEGARPFALDIDRVLRLAAEKPSIVFIVNPNNPTGNLISPEDLLKVLTETESFLVVDEAYYEYAGVTLAKEVARHPRLAVLRTLSKAFGLAGLRLGYLIASPEVVAALDRVRLPFNVNTFTQSVARVAVENAHLFRPQVAALLAERDKLWAGLAALPGVRPFPTHTNFILFSVPKPPTEVWRRLFAAGILILDVSREPLLKSCLRVSTGSAEENAVFLKALATALA